MVPLGGRHGRHLEGAREPAHSARPRDRVRRLRRRALRRRQGLAGLERGDLDDSGWQAAAVFTPPTGADSGSDGGAEPDGRDDSSATRVEAYPQGGWVIDMGKAFTGWLEISLPAIPKGTTVKLEYSDQMTPDKPAPEPPLEERAGPAASGMRRVRMRLAGEVPAPQPRLEALPPPAPPLGAVPLRRARQQARRGAAVEETLLSSEHVQPARRDRRERRRADVPVAVQLPRVPIRARDRARDRSEGLERHGVPHSHGVRPGRRVHLVQCAAEPDLSDGHLDLRSRSRLAATSWIARRASGSATAAMRERRSRPACSTSPPAASTTAGSPTGATRRWQPVRCRTRRRTTRTRGVAVRCGADSS